MSSYDSNDLLSLFNRFSGRPSADAIMNDSKFDRLSKSQNNVIALIAGVAPYSLYPKGGYSSLPTMTTADSQVFTFGLDSDNNPIFPIGKVGIYTDLGSVPDYPWREGYDYLNEGNQIRIPNNRTYTGSLFWRGIVPPPDISATVQPVLQPLPARELIVLDAVRKFAMENDRNEGLAQAMANEWNVAWPKWCLVFKTQFRSGGALGSWTTREVAASSSWSN